MPPEASYSVTALSRLSPVITRVLPFCVMLTASSVRSSRRSRPKIWMSGMAALSQVWLPVDRRGGRSRSAPGAPASQDTGRDVTVRRRGRCGSVLVDVLELDELHGADALVKRLVGVVEPLVDVLELIEAGAAVDGHLAVEGR